MGRKSNAQKLEETTERLTDAIKYNKEDLQKDINYIKRLHLSKILIRKCLYWIYIKED